MLRAQVTSLARRSSNTWESRLHYRWSPSLARSGVQLGSGCRLHESWFLPDLVFGWHQVMYAEYSFVMGGIPAYLTSPWYSLQSDFHTSEAFTSSWTSGCSSERWQSTDSTSTGELGTSLDPLLVLP